MTLKMKSGEVNQLRRNLGEPKITAHAKERAKSELLTPFMRTYVEANGITRLTAEIINSPEYVKALRHYWDLFVPMVLERMRRDATK